MAQNGGVAYTMLQNSLWEWDVPCTECQVTHGHVGIDLRKTTSPSVATSLISAFFSRPVQLGLIILQRFGCSSLVLEQQRFTVTASTAINTTHNIITCDNIFNFLICGYG